ncbi:MAG: cyclic nucleotide-binding domain-containing protein [Pseudomonadota bacterium]
MSTVFLSPDLLVVAAGGSYVLGYLLINQVALRWTLFAGSIFYIGYYATAADAPLWSAIWLTVLMTLANLAGLGALYWHRSSWAVPRASRALYREFAKMPPGDFRKLMRLAQRRTLDQDLQVSAEGQPIEHLYYIASGSAEVKKKGHVFQLPAHVFVGEVAFLQATNSAATTTLRSGSEILEWQFSDLRRASVRSPSFGGALDLLISRDLANKMSVAVAPDTLTDRPNEPWRRWPEQEHEDVSDFEECLHTV